MAADLNGDGALDFVSNNGAVVALMRQQLRVVGDMAPSACWPMGWFVVGSASAAAQQRNRVRGGHFAIDDRTTYRFFKVLLARRG